ncbi:MAG: hypothetical protein LBM28_05095 [Oscillospiraceae bacterium]|jgi:hypothetical protein|nr:hypothetical protein [Oscillospiraceae bacterium]
MPKMKDFLRVFFSIINFISWGLLVIIGAAGIVYEIFGPVRYDKMIHALKIPLSLGRTYALTAICVLVLILCHFVRKKLTKNM